MGVEALANYYLINTNTSLSNKVKNDTAGKKDVYKRQTVDNAVIDVNGFGINVRISADTASRLPGIGEQVRLYTYLSLIHISGTIRDNITYGCENVSEEELQNVIKAANLSDLIASLP